MSKRKYMRVVICDECSEGLEHVGLNREKADEAVHVAYCDWCRAVFDSDFSGHKQRYRMWWAALTKRGETK